MPGSALYDLDCFTSDLLVGLICFESSWDFLFSRTATGSCGRVDLLNVVMTDCADCVNTIHEIENTS